MSVRVGIIDYGICNLSSVVNAFLHIGCDVKIVSDRKKFAEFTHLVLPGVGSFPKGMENLQKKGLDEAICREAERGKPILGLCLGMQLFAETGEEFGLTNGLGLIQGSVSIINVNQSELRVPHVGWNKVYLNKNSIIAAGIQQSSAFYFIHSYSYSDSEASYVVGVCDYSSKIVSIIEKDNIFGAQFHPEKSQSDGLLLLKNFSNISS
jgi:glutamine amidotransferase